jgi:hypothetical protein
VTALSQYQRLESTGLWRPEAEAQRLNVYVFVGQATLVIADKAEAPLAHWSLAAIERVNPGNQPAIFVPGPDSDETLEIEDQDMIEAIEKVQRAVRRAEPRSGRLRLWIAVGCAVLAVGLATLWLPRSVAHHAAEVLPDVQKAQIGEALLGELQRLTGPPCGGPTQEAVLRRLSTRSFGADAPRLHVMRDGIVHALQLPGGAMVVSHSLVEDYETAAPVAGFMLAARARAEASPPIEALLSDAGVVAVLRLLTTGELPQSALRQHAQALVRLEPDMPTSPDLADVFARARVPVTPYARAIDITGESTAGLIAADPFPGPDAPIVLDDNSWVVLQGICAE